MLLMMLAGLSQQLSVSQECQPKQDPVVAEVMLFKQDTACHSPEADQTGLTQLLQSSAWSISFNTLTPVLAQLAGAIKHTAKTGPKGLWPCWQTATACHKAEGNDVVLSLSLSMLPHL